MVRRTGRKRHKGPTIGDVAAAAGVSAMTVSRVINQEANVRPSTREKVEAAIAELRYAPSAAARALAGGEQIRIGLLHSNPSFAYLSDFLMGSLDAASRSNVQLVVEKCADERDVEAVTHLVEGRIDGIVLPPPLCDSGPILSVLQAAAIPVVAVATGKAPEWALSVGIDDQAAAYAMTRHLATLGHRRIGFITGNANLSASGERLRGYRAALADCGLGDERLDGGAQWVAEGDFTYRSGLAAAAHLLNASPRPTAIFASNDDMAAAAVAIAHRRGLDVPGDLSICGFDDTALATTIWPELSTIRQPTAQMARIAVEMLVRDIRARTPIAADARHVLVDHRLVRRQSDAPPPAETPA
ncbi:LacI family DNA-binding transcriptional regulator [Sphingobium sufflavum]|uniref:LacI family DNA-binding transcriptional regulator n=1 Tax=Sphingobium sufflavum TaxID=1129547 RepID=UPI001F158E11|nr:LacI family DNA-binding transcriptional regulator [Sphingobium sufflavum]MCE7797985.1 LacI family DNA-binding transcriptional regulator [Sphingobium sufflavum]